MRFPWRLIGLLIAIVVAGYIVLGVLHWLISLLFPILVLSAIAYVLYVIVDRKALGGNKKSLY